MFGESIDYALLKPLTHDANRATAAELDAQAARSTYTLAEATGYLERVCSELFFGRFRVSEELSYLDVGCGMGRMSLGLAAAGARDVTGIDIVGRHVKQAASLAERLLPPATRPSFHAADIHSWKSGRRFDVVIVLGALEHILDLPEFLKRLPGLLRPGGHCYVSIEPFHSPYGDHMRHFFRCYVPWNGLIFNERAVLRLRREKYRPDDSAMRYEDIEGGLNKVRYGAYRRMLDSVGLCVSEHFSNPQLRRMGRPVYALSSLCSRIPFLRDFIIITDYAVLRADG